MYISSWYNTKCMERFPHKSMIIFTVISFVSNSHQQLLTLSVQYCQILDTLNPDESIPMNNLLILLSNNVNEEIILPNIVPLIVAANF